MNKTLTLLLMAFSLTATAQTDYNPESCTSIMVGRKASADGSVITTHTCDGSYRSAVYVKPAADYDRDTVVTIYSGRMQTEHELDRTPLVEKGQIPQVRHTYRFLDTAYPCINEHQLAFGETTVTGKAVLRDPDGMFRIEELQRIALERCTTAREAIRLMGQLVKDYGYCDSGECLSVADTREVWHFEVFGEGKGHRGGVWAAVRIPDDHVGVSANIARIAEVDTTDTNRCMASANYSEVALRLGLWDGKQPFSFWRAYGNNYAHPDKQKNFDIREYYIFNALAPSLHLDYEADELPISIKPDHKVTVAELLALYRQTYEGTRFDPRKDLLSVTTTDGRSDTVTSYRANPWMTAEDKRMLAHLRGGERVAKYRPVPVAFCSYATVVQLRSWLPDDIGGVVWFSLDNPAESPRIPIYCGTVSLPETMRTNGNKRYRDDAAIWHFRTPNKLAALNWGKARTDIEDGIRHFEQKGFGEMSYVQSMYQQIAKEQGRDQARAFLSGYTADFLGATMLRWDEMCRRLLFSGKNGF